MWRRITNRFPAAVCLPCRPPERPRRPCERGDGAAGIRSGSYRRHCWARWLSRGGLVILNPAAQPPPRPATGLRLAAPGFRAGHLQHGEPFIYGQTSDDAKLTLYGDARAFSPDVETSPVVGRAKFEVPFYAGTDCPASYAICKLYPTSQSTLPDTSENRYLII